ncbi:Ldh family oxidoreductase [Streptomyces sp. ODS28]|uniref:Ldh family oxidoreductase n=1 Tax=Streptomyces sp. ODS28 TaxID=3136688 RepID=UPI0031EB9E88
MRIGIAEIRTLMAEVCLRTAVPEEDIDLVVDHYLEGELRGKPTHGIAKFCFECRFFAERQGRPRITHEHGGLAVVDGRREVGPVSADFAVRTAVRKARESGVGMVGVLNVQRYGVLAPWAEHIAHQGMFGLVMNTSRPDGTIEGGRTPFLGVNPLSFAFPTREAPVAIDMSTTKAPMGLLWECRRSGTPLPPGCFVDAHGDFTEDPHEAESAVVFGGHKGFAVSLMVQILTGSLFGFPMSHEVTSTWETGYAFMAVDPSFGGALNAFAADNQRLLEAMEKATTREGDSVRIPGRESEARMRAALESGYLTLDGVLHARLRARAAGDFDTD